MNLTLEKRAVLIKNLIEERWKIGDLYYKLKDHQIDLYNQITKGSNKKHVVNCSRRFGKSYTLCLIAIEHALKSKVHVRFAAPTSTPTAGATPARFLSTGGLVFSYL